MSHWLTSIQDTTMKPLVLRLSCIAFSLALLPLLPVAAQGTISIKTGTIKLATPGQDSTKEGAKNDRNAALKLSPRDSLTAKVGDATVSINYGRPSKRDREIFGGLVPFDKVWRTGANEATSLTVDKDIEIGGEKVPAGSYTIYTIPGKSSWTLILNKQTGQWGTQYDEKQDLVRIPLKVETIATPVEKFEIKIEADTLYLIWDKTQASVALTQ